MWLHALWQVRVVICEWLAWMLRIKRPGRELTIADLRRRQRVRRLEALVPPSASLINNVKDVDNTIPLGSRGSSVRPDAEAPPTVAANNNCPPYQVAAAASRPFFYGFVSIGLISSDLVIFIYVCESWTVTLEYLQLVHLYLFILPF